MIGKYHGILKRFNFEDNSIENINKLIATNIFEKIYHEFNSENESENENIKDWFFGETDNIIFFKELYIFKNEIYKDVLNNILHSFIFNDLVEFTNEIEIKVNQKLLNADKIEIYKNSYQEQYNKIKNKTFYALFKNKKETQGFETFEEYFITEFTNDYNDLKNTKNYLIGAKNYINDELFYMLWDYYLTSYIYDYCNEQIKLLQNENKLLNEKDTKNIDLSFQICLIEEILLKAYAWKDITAPKKGELLTHLLGKSKENIRKGYNELDKKKSEISKKFLEDREKAENLIKKYLG